MKIGDPNQHAGTCIRCGQLVEAGEGVMRREVAASGEYRWRPEHAECPSADDDGPPEIPTWAVFGTGRTLAGNVVAGAASVEQHTRPPDSLPLNGAANARCVRPERSSASTARAWIAYAWLRGILPRPANVTIEQLDELLADVRLDEFDDAVAAARQRSPLPEPVA